LDGDIQLGLELTSFGVALKAEHNFGSTIPSSGDIFRHVPGVLFWIHRKASRQAEIANFKLAVGIDQQISRFEVAVQDISGVNVLQAAKDLVDEGLEMRIRERLSRSDNRCQVTLHEF
jgi:hypothetical protein